MKRLFFSLGLLFLLLLTAVIMNLGTSQALENLLNLLDEAEWAATTGDMELAADQALEALSDWEEISLPVNILHAHQDVLAVSDKLSLAYEAADNGAVDNFREYSRSAVTLLTQMMTAHDLNWENIF